jgi:hypothetical protein
MGAVGVTAQRLRDRPQTVKQEKQGIFTHLVFVDCQLVGSLT